MCFARSGPAITSVPWGHGIYLLRSVYNKDYGIKDTSLLLLRDLQIRTKIHLFISFILYYLNRVAPSIIKVLFFKNQTIHVVVFNDQRCDCIVKFKKTEVIGEGS